MKRFLPPLLALPLLLGACSTAYRSNANLVSPPAVRTADLNSSWGQRPTYDQKGQYFYPVTPRTDNLQDAFGSGGAVVDVLVNRDGTVQAVALVSSSGDHVRDNLAVDVLQKSRYSLTLPAEMPAPYVVRHKFNFYSGWFARSYADSDNSYNNGNVDTSGSPQATNPGNSNTVNGFVR